MTCSIMTCWLSEVWQRGAMRRLECSRAAGQSALLGKRLASGGAVTAAIRATCAVCIASRRTYSARRVHSRDEFFEDVWRVTGGQTNEALARHVIRASESCTDWMKGYGVRFQPSLGGTLHLGRTNAFFLGGGKALVNTYYQAAERLGVNILYEAEAERLVFDGTRFDHALVNINGSLRKFSARAVVVASGGFESNQAWALKRPGGQCRATS